MKNYTLELKNGPHGNRGDYHGLQGKKKLTQYSLPQSKKKKRDYEVAEKILKKKLTKPPKYRYM